MDRPSMTYFQDEQRLDEFAQIVRAVRFGNGLIVD
jgi:hypothetical protein